MMRTPRRALKFPVRTLWAISLAAVMWGLGGCHGGALWGAGFGALFGQAIGGDTESTLAGAAIGALIGAEASSHHYAGHHYSGHYHTTAPSYHYHVSYGRDCY